MYALFVHCDCSGIPFSVACYYIHNSLYCCRNGGHCYSKCDGFTVIPNEKSGSVGSYRGDGLALERANANCMWIITTANKTTVDVLSLTTLSDVEYFLRQSQSDRAEIIFTINKLDMNTVCGEDVVYVYDGLPAFVLNLNSSQVDFNSKLIAAYCGEEPVTRPVKAVSGVMVVWYRGSVETIDGRQKGFNASYEICGVGCGKNTSCNESRDCECDECDAAMMTAGWETAICPSSCANNGTECDEVSQLCFKSLSPLIVGNGVTVHVCNWCCLAVQLSVIVSLQLSVWIDGWMNGYVCNTRLYHKW